MIRLPIYILAGGRSRRFGSDKARAMFQGQPLLGHVATLLEPVASRITVVADRACKYDDLGFPTIADSLPGLGPLAGLQTALTDLPQEEDWLLLCSCDALVVRPAWLQTLLQACDARHHAEQRNCAQRNCEQHNAVAFRAAHWQPMPGLYSRCALPVVNQSLASEDRSMNKLLNQLTVKAVQLPTDWPQQWQANTPQELMFFSNYNTKDTEQVWEAS